METLVGPARDGRLLELGVILEEPERIIHADYARPSIIARIFRETNMTTKPKITDKQALRELEDFDPTDVDFQDLSTLAAISAWVRERDEHDSKLVGLVRAGRAQGVSWAHIGARLGITKQAAHERFAKEIA
ncbi:MAG TPA: hypothetical protein VFY56_15225 [Propionibacteriaceae bacterium]|nr:hypothetical protein [Propionibacteriaceae bacterium]